ncbi:hypothetical protein PWT90_11071 [Aphanocladium album]|nr:hypothetical protein PWT90_11071 [Aphanocladium album]
MSPAAISPLASVKALTFDVFGTTVDWRTSVIDELELRVHRKLSASPDDAGAPSTEMRERLVYLNEQYNPANRESGIDSWTARFADAWRSSYWQFVRSQARAGTQDAASFKTTDEHFYDSLLELLEEWLLEDLFSDDELKSLSLVWHRLAPRADSPEGLAKLAAQGLVTATLSNGSTALIRDLNDFGDLGFRRQFCAESLKAYKPAPETYLGAVRELGLKPEEVAMVAAHMADLEAARSVGLRTIYVERVKEEEWSKERLEEARSWVDLWIKEDEGGFVRLAQRLEQLRA